MARKESSARRPHMMVGGDTTFIVRIAITLFLYTIRVVSNRDIYSEGNGMCTRRSRMPAFFTNLVGRRLHTTRGCRREAAGRQSAPERPGGKGKKGGKVHGVRFAELSIIVECESGVQWCGDTWCSCCQNCWAQEYTLHPTDLEKNTIEDQRY